MAKNTVFLTINIFEGQKLYNISFSEKTISIPQATHNTCIYVTLSEQQILNNLKFKNATDIPSLKEKNY